MKKIQITIFLILISFNAFTQIKSMPGAFTRMGFEATGLSLGNSIIAERKDVISPYYNPARIVFQEKISFNLSYTFLNLDRKLNTFSFILPIKLKQENGEVLRSAISAGLINSEVNNIDGRDLDGFHTKNLSTFEDQFFLAVSALFSKNLSIGANFKFNYAKLYENITSSGFGIDIGILYIYNSNISFGFMIRDINTSYEWDTSELYGQNGNNTKEKFPLIKIIGMSYNFTNDFYFHFSFENSNQKTNILKFGSEYEFNNNFKIRIGVDRIDVSNSSNGVKPTFGFSYSNEFNSLKPTLNYALCIEPFTHYPIQMLTLTIQL